MIPKTFPWCTQARVHTGNIMQRTPEALANLLLRAGARQGGPKAGDPQDAGRDRQAAPVRVGAAVEEHEHRRLAKAMAEHDAEFSARHGLKQRPDIRASAKC